MLQQTHQCNTVLTIFSPTSSKATRQHSLPFSFKQCVFYNPNLTPAPAGFSIVGITADSALVHIGDAVEPQVDLGAQAKPFNARGLRSSHPTLWQDIFGKSALLLDAAHVEPPWDPAKNRNSRRMDWGILTEGGPSHLLPAAGVLFEPLIESLLGMSEGHNTSHMRGQKKGPEEDIEMEDVQEQPPRDTTRDVTGGEMDMLVELFKRTEFTSAFRYYPGSICVNLPYPTASSHCSPATSSTLKPKLLTNGPQKPPVGKPNGVHPDITSSQPLSPVVTPTKKHAKPNGNGAIPSPVISTAEKVISSESPIKIGKKRKKPAVE